MKCNFIMREEIDNRYQGYCPTSIAVRKDSEEYLSRYYRKLRRVPKKISAFFKRENIKTVFKSDCYTDKRDEYYLIVDTKGKVYQIEY